jgi:hypothetical protein
MELGGAVDEMVSVGVVGATSLVGGCILRLYAHQNRSVNAFSRHPARTAGPNRVNWYGLGQDAHIHVTAPSIPIPHWIYVAPIWTLQEHLPFFLAMGARRIVAISSTSRFTKATGRSFAEPLENQIAEKIADAEKFFIRWTEERGIEWIILRPTLVYGFGRDKNISEIARFIYRFRCFPLFGDAQGLRQPIHADDVAISAIAALNSRDVQAQAFNISGGEVLTYTEMVSRIFLACQKSQRFIHIPWIVFKFGLSFLALFPRYRRWNPSMAARMNADLIFDSEDACRQLGLSPRKFILTNLDLPKM